MHAYVSCILTLQNLVTIVTISLNFDQNMEPQSVLTRDPKLLGALQPPVSLNLCP